MVKENLTWRSFADPGDLGSGVIATKWNLAGTPTLYVLDQTGVIQYKWIGNPGAMVIDSALEKVLGTRPRPR
jgi:hypothetical protein